LRIGGQFNVVNSKLSVFVHCAKCRRTLRAPARGARAARADAARRFGAGELLIVAVVVAMVVLVRAILRLAKK